MSTDLDKIGDLLQQEVGEDPEKVPAFDPSKAALQTLAERELCRRHLLPYVMKTNSAYQPGWVHQLICKELEEFSAAVVRKESPRLMLFMPPRHGKQIHHDAAVYTPDGWRKHGDLRPGDFVYHPSGGPVEVLALSEVTDSDWVVTFSNGEQIRCHGNHEWTVYDRPNKCTRTVETRWFVEASKKTGRPRKLTSGEMGKRGGRYLYQLPLVGGPLENSPKPLLIHPYVLGAWLGDGTKSKPSFCFDSRHVEHILKIKKILGQEPTVGGHLDYENVATVYFGGGALLPHIRALNVFNNKHIPDIYLRGSVEQRKELLAGLVDTDGHVDEKGRVRFSTTSEALRDGVFELALSLNYRPYHMAPTSPALSTSGIQGQLTVYQVGFQPTEPLLTVLPHKQVTRFAPQRRVSIVSVEYRPDGSKGRCIQVDSPDGLYLVGRSLLPTHNSELASRTFPTWHLGRNPTHEIIACSYASSLALKFSRKARALAREPLFQQLFNVTLDDDQQSAENWLTTQGGGYMPAGVQGPVTGNGCHVGIIDDPVKNREEAESATVRESIKDWYTSTFYTRLAPGAGILVVLTRWHDDDLAGWQLKEMFEGRGDAWKVVKFPAIAIEDEEHRKKGEALHPERYPIEALRRIERVIGPRDFNALYQQNPIAEEGDYFTRDMLKYYRTVDLPPPTELTYYSAWDFAIGKNETNDWTVGITVAFDKQDRIFIVDLVRGRWDAYEIVERVLDNFALWKPIHVGLEKGQIAMALGPHLERRIAERNLWEFPYDEKHLLKTGKQDKQARARSIQGRMRQGRVFFPEEASWTQELVNELLRFPSGIHDDQVDALAWIGIMMTMFFHTEPVEDDPTPKWFKNFIAKQSSGPNSSAMSA